MSKKLTLDETWEQCLKMWRWIVRQKAPQKAPRAIYNLKREYQKKHNLIATCLFCRYVNERGRGCDFCPACQVDKTFHCYNEDYSYNRKPATFLRKITELNKIRLSKKT